MVVRYKQAYKQSFKIILTTVHINRLSMVFDNIELHQTHLYYGLFFILKFQEYVIQVLGHCDSLLV